MTHELVKKLAKQTFLAFENPYKSINKVFPTAIDKIADEPFYYLGVKNRPEIPNELIHSLEKSGNYALHTLDNYAFGGRAIDTLMTNPLTGQPMTGSSSGTAVNVFLGINDIGIGTDGGGSVLAPALSLHLFSFISPSIAKEHTSAYLKQSTDGQSFSPSIGIMSRQLSILREIVSLVLPVELNEEINKLNVLVVYDKERYSLNLESSDSIKVTYIQTNLSASRHELIQHTRRWLEEYDMIISKEGPIDFHGLGDSIIGHVGSEAKAYQNKGNKGLVRIANMINAAALTVPTESLATGYVVLSKESEEHIGNLFRIAERLETEQDELLDKYFRDFGTYLNEGLFNQRDS
ncbi:amidase family protein [Alkalibacterium pelagium]|uniref:Amidase n=1 Tax=Alkalibacterium pelagium TaxID=426702 RepID=A0A1H7HWP8_9LACT|nr:amidase family protein [Alkalibacterium pelagium]GEN50335.1 hypothetical protein APE02nite_10000 [Alkalibacterium pelagium]SEK54057.1 Amidase [Alkalibacterium pelagium]